MITLSFIENKKFQKVSKSFKKFQKVSKKFQKSFNFG